MSKKLQTYENDAITVTSAPGAAVTIRPAKDGPLLVSGTVRVESEDGSLLQEGDKLALCRCGGTSNPPFCDGTHRKIGYRSKR